jgi:hypothetical protein
MKLSKNIKKGVIGKRPIAVILCILLVMTALTTTTAISFTDQQKEQTQMNIDHLSYTFSFAEPTLQLTTSHDSVYSKIQMPGCLSLGKQAGDPSMPVKFIQLLLPPQMTVDSIEVTGTPVELNLQGIDLTTQRIYPYQSEIPIGSDVPQEFVMNNELYSSNQLYPAENHGAYHIGYSHGYAILDLSLSPMQFTPNNGEIFYYPEMTVTINLKGNGYQNPLFRGTPEDEAWVPRVNTKLRRFTNL